MTSPTAKYEHLFPPNPAHLPGFVDPLEKVVFLDDERGATKVLTWENHHITETTMPVRHLKRRRDFKPLGNGFNLELANEMYDLISGQHEDDWNQGVWRVLDIYNNPDSSYAEEVTRKFVQADYEHPCGTAMCAAGWIGEVTGVDWVVDATMMSSSARTRDMLTNKAEFILVPKSLGTKVPTLNGHGDYWGNLDGTIKEMLRLRGFTGSTHMLMTVSGWAEYQLGLVNGDFLELFSGNNGLQDIRLLIDLYAEVGPAHNDSTLFDSRDTVVAHIMNMIDKEDRGFVRKMAELHEASPEAPLLDVAREALAYVYDSERVPEAYFRDGLV